MLRAISVVALAGLVALAGCRRTDPNALDPAAFEAVAWAADFELNEPVAAIYATMRAAAEQPQVAWDALVINLDGSPEPVNWWMLDKGWLRLAGAQFVNRPVFALSEQARALLASPDEPWFAVEVPEGAEPEVDCVSAGAMVTGGCEVAMDIQPVLTDAGRAILGSRTLSPVRVQTTLRVGMEDWETGTLSVNGPALYLVALEAILGPEESRQAMREGAEQRLGLQVQALAPPDLSPTYDPNAPYVPPTYIEGPAPVAPIGAEARPGEVLGLGLPDVVRER